MGDTNLRTSKLTGAKPRLSLMSSKQTGIRLSSEDQCDQDTDTPCIALEDNSVMSGLEPMERQLDQKQYPETQQSLKPEQESLVPNGRTQNDKNKTNISKEDLIRLLSMLKSELQSKEIALAAIKCEQLKRLINPVEISQSSFASTYLELQNRLKRRDQNNNGSSKDTGQSSCTVARDGQTRAAQTYDQTTKDLNDEQDDQETLNILNTLLELLDRHPLLALPRDSIYCLDYSCNEVSTKNYLNLKIHHLDNLINQHRRFRYIMNERLKRSEQRYLDLSREFELEKSTRCEKERLEYVGGGKSTLLRNIDQLKETLEKEREDKRAIVVTLLNELLDERERSVALSKNLAKYESDSSSEKTVCEREKVISMEAKVNELKMQLEKQSVVFSKERDDLQQRVIDLEAENSSLKSKLEHQEWRLNSPAKISSNSESPKELKQINNLSSTNKSGINVIQTAPVSKHPPTSASSAVITCNLVGSASKSSPVSKILPKDPNTGSGRTSAQVVSTAVSGTSPNYITKYFSNTSVGRKPSAPPILSRPQTSPSAEQISIRVQPQFKSASVLSTNQQVRNTKSSTSSGTSSSAPFVRSSSGTTIKPQVPAKPAQLIDQQRGTSS